MDNTTFDIDQYSIEISTKDIIDLEALWMSLQQQQPVNFFLSWAWISTWLNTYQPNIKVITAKHQDQLVAIGLITGSTEQRHGFIKSRQIRLHQTGQTSQDQIWIEYNDLLCLKKHQPSATQACIQALFDKSTPFYESWDEIVLSMMPKISASNLLLNLPNSRITYQATAYASHLLKIRTKSQSFIESLSSNTRYQIRRSLRRYEEKFGKLALSHAKTKKQAHQFFNDAGKLHQQRWSDSGYNNPDFIQFHTNLINQYFDHHSIHLTKVTFGQTTIAILYYHIRDKVVNFYLQGLLYDHDKKLKPGLVAHALMSQYFLELGMDVYDYMGGDSQYKKQLSNQTEQMISLTIQKPRLDFYIEDTARYLKHTLKRFINNKN